MGGMERYDGKVQWFNNAKGYGFLLFEGHPDLFCHFTAIQSEGYKKLTEGQRVEFSIGKGPDGKLQAVEVVPLSQ